MLPLLVLTGLGLGLYFANKSSSSSATASNGTTVSLPGLVVPAGLTLTSADVATIRSFVNGTLTIEGTSTSLLAPAPRLARLNELLVSYKTQLQYTPRLAFLEFLRELE